MRIGMAVLPNFLGEPQQEAEGELSTATARAGRALLGSRSSSGGGQWLPAVLAARTAPPRLRSLLASLVPQV
jgi:hypothetical protein